MDYHLEMSPTAFQKEAIGDFVKRSTHSHYLQDPLWVDVTGRTRPGQYLYFWGEEDGEVRVSALVRRMRLPLAGWAKDMVERGPVCDSVEQLAESLPHLGHMLRATGSVSLMINPYWADEDAERVESCLDGLEYCLVKRRGGPHKVTLWVDLSPDEEAILMGLRKKTRYEIRKAEKMGVEVSPARNEEDMLEFCELYRQSAAALGLKPLAVDYVKRLWHGWLRGEERGVCLMARYQGELIAAEIVLRCDHRAEQLHAPSISGGARDLPKNHLLVWRTLLWAKAKGCRIYDLAGIDATAAEDSQIAGVNWFKMGFSGEPVRLVPERECVFHPQRYRWLSWIASYRGRRIPTA